MSELKKSMSIPADVSERLKTIFQNLFGETVEPIDSLTAGDVEGWDSITHVKLILAVEEAFQVRFKLQEISSLKNIGDLKNSIIKKLTVPKLTD